MQEHDYKYNQRVVPHAKSTGASLNGSYPWNQVKNTSEPWLYYVKPARHQDDGHILASKPDTQSGDYFLLSDFSPYYENDLHNAKEL